MTENAEQEEQAAVATFPNVLAAVEYLKTGGWKIAKSMAYQHRNEGKLRPREDGLFHLKDVLKYARTFLRRYETGKTAWADLDTVQQEKSRAEADKLRSQAGMAALKLKIAEQQYVEKSYFDQELAKRAVFLKNDLLTFCRSSAPEIIALVGGDAEKTPDLIEHMLDAMEDCLDRYAADREFSLPAPAVPSDEPTIEEDEEEEEI